MPFQSPKTVENCERCIGRTSKKPKTPPVVVFSFRSRLASPTARDSTAEKLTDFRSHTTTTGTPALAGTRPGVRTRPEALGHRRRRGRIGRQRQVQRVCPLGRRSRIRDAGARRRPRRHRRALPRDEPVPTRSVRGNGAREEGFGAIVGRRVGQERRRRQRRRREESAVAVAAAPRAARPEPLAVAERRAGHRAHAAESERALERGGALRQLGTDADGCLARRHAERRVPGGCARRRRLRRRRRPPAASPATAATAERRVSLTLTRCAVWRRRIRRERDPWCTR